MNAELNGESDGEQLRHADDVEVHVDFDQESLLKLASPPGGTTPAGSSSSSSDSGHFGFRNKFTKKV